MKAFVALPVLLAIAFIFSGCSFLLSYHNLTSEQKIANLIFVPADSSDSDTKKMEIIYQIDAMNYRKFPLRGGDEWEIDCVIVKPRYLLEAIGMSPRYKVDRIVTRYRDKVKDSKDSTDLIDLSEYAQVNQPHHNILMRIINGIGNIIFWLFFDVSYGSANYAPIIGGASFDIYITPTGLLTRPENSVARNAIATKKWWQEYK